MIVGFAPQLLLAALVAWLVALVLASRVGPERPRALLPVALVLAFVGAGCALTALRWPTDWSIPPAETGFLAAWLLVGLQVARLQVDTRSLAITARDGFFALASFALAIETSRLIGPVGGYLTGAPWVAEFAAWLALAAAFGIGHALSTIGTPERHAWEYAVCFAAWVILLGTLHPAFARLDPAAFHGAATLAGALMASALLRFALGPAALGQPARIHHPVLDDR